MGPRNVISAACAVLLSLFVTTPDILAQEAPGQAVRVDPISGAITSPVSPASLAAANGFATAEVIQTFGDANVTVAPTTTVLQLTAAITAPRVITLPAASVRGKLTIVDTVGTVTATNYLTLTPASGDAVNVTQLSAAYAAPILISDKVHTWTIDVAGIPRGGTGSPTAAGARTNLGIGTAGTQSNSFFLQSANNFSDLASLNAARANLGVQGLISARLLSTYTTSLPATNAALATISTGGGTPGSCTQSITVGQDVSQNFNIYGGAPGGAHNGSAQYYFAASYLSPAMGSGNCAGQMNNNGWAIDFMTDAATMAVGIQGYSQVFNVKVDGQYVVLNQANVATGGVQPVVITPATSGIHRYTFESMAGSPLYSLAIPPIAKMWRPYTPNGVRISVVGDSITAGTGESLIRQSWGEIMGKYLGTDDVWLSAIGGTGYINTGTGTVAAIGRTSDLTLAQPDVVVVALGINDSASSPSTLTTAVTTYLQAVRALGGKMATCPIFVLGPFNGSYATAPTSATIASVETAIFNGVSAVADSRIFTVSTQDAAGTGVGAWETGTGTTAATTGNGNNDIYMNPVSGGTYQSPHPNAAGHAYYGQRAARAIASLLRTYQP